MIACNYAEMGFIMKFFHLSDLHFGKQLHGYDLIEEQREIIQSLMNAAKKERPDAIVIAGDIYDRSVPSGSAMALLEELFLGIDGLSNGSGELQGAAGLSEREKPIELLIIAGNHDSAPRLRYGSAFLERHHIHIAVFPPREEQEGIQKVTLSDGQGNVNFYLLPYTSVGMLRGLAGGERLESADDAVRFLLERETIDWSERNVLVSHQFYLHGGKVPEQCDSEAPRLYVGGLDAVNTTTVERFDYVALGHIHSPQNLGSGHIRYCGAPYPYSVSEAAQKKSVTVVEFGKKGEVTVKSIPLEPLRKIQRLRGTLEEVASMAAGINDVDDYVSITLTDEEPLEEPKEYLERYYGHILEIKIDNQRSKKMLEEEIQDMQELTPFEAFEAFFKDSAGRQMNESEKTEFMAILDGLSDGRIE